MPKGVRFHKLGGPEVLEIEEVALRPPGEGEALMRVEAVGLNRAESMYFHGHCMEQPKLPSGLGYEAVGVVTAVDPGEDPASVTGYTLHEITANPEVSARARQYIFKGLGDGRLKPKVAKTFALAQVREAYRYLESNQQAGKIVITAAAA